MKKTCSLITAFVAAILAITTLLSMCACNPLEQVKDTDAATDATQPTVTTIPTTTQTEPTQPASPIAEFLPLDFRFSSGVGGWGTSLSLQSDGTFTGSYSDSNMGDRDEETYPNGTVYIAKFSGHFENITKINDYTYTMTLAEINAEDIDGKTRSEGEIWVEDGFRYIAASPYGMESGEEFIFYTPDTPTDKLPENFLMWWPKYHYDPPSTLSCYAIRNKQMEYGFFAY